MGHIDEIGLIVTHIDDEGYLWFREVGGWDAQILVGQRVVLSTREGEVAGVIGKKPIHLLREEERKKVAEVRDLHIDIGARDGEQARELVRVGDVAVIDGDPLELPNGEPGGMGAPEGGEGLGEPPDADTHAEGVPTTSTCTCAPNACAAARHTAAGAVS
jgi:M42 glutamyl aminopeptidase